jgi:plasmid maintenance system antidote protein VapI
MIRVPTHREPTHPGEMLLEEFFGMSAGFWMILQLRWDLYHAELDEKRVLDTI